MKSRIIVPALLVCCGLAITGCAGTHLYDKSEARIATSIKTKYTESNIPGTIEIQKNNLEALLAEELKVVRENHCLQVDFALLELADNDTPIADTWRDEIDAPPEQLGVDSSTGGLREFIIALDDIAELNREMAAEGVQFPWRWNDSTISTNSEVIWGMSV